MESYHEVKEGCDGTSARILFHILNDHLNGTGKWRVKFRLPRSLLQPTQCSVSRKWDSEHSRCGPQTSTANFHIG